MTLPGGFVGDPPHLAQLLHEVRLGVQAAGGVGEHEVGVAGGGPLDGVEDDRARVGALGAAHEVGAGPLGPGGELLGGRGPERVARGHHDRAAVARPRAWRPCRWWWSCPTPLTPTNSHTFVVPASWRRPAVVDRQPRLHLVLDRVDELRAVSRGRRPSPRARTESSSSVVGADADVGADQRLLEVVPGLLVDLRPGEDAADVAGERCRGPWPGGRGTRARVGTSTSGTTVMSGSRTSGSRTGGSADLRLDASAVPVRRRRAGRRLELRAAPAAGCGDEVGRCGREDQGGDGDDDDGSHGRASLRADRARPDGAIRPPAPGRADRHDAQPGAARREPVRADAGAGAAGRTAAGQGGVRYGAVPG